MYDWASQVSINSTQVLYYVHTHSGPKQKILNQTTCGLNADLIVHGLYLQNIH